MLIHKDCGGEIVQSDILYPYETEGGRPYTIAGVKCARCNKEILGDPEIEFDNPEDEALWQEMVGADV